MNINQKLDPKFINVDPLKPSYRDSIVDNPERFHRERLRHSALLCVDLQYLDAAEGFGVFANAARSGAPLEAQEYYFNSLKNTVLPNVRRLQECFRAHGLEVIHTRIQSLTQDGRDRSPSHKRLNLLAPPGSKEAEFLEEVAPCGDEIIINKTASGVFTSTNMFYLLKNLDIDSLYVVGVYSSECVSTTVRDASDLGFFVTLIEDGCTTVTPMQHESTIVTLRDRYAHVVTTNQAIEEIDGVLGGGRTVVENRTASASRR